PRLKVEYKDTEQAHLCLAVRGIPLLHPDRYALDLLNVILGEGMSSRLFQEIREKHCLAYDIHSYVNYFRDAGSLVIGAGVDPKQLSRTISAILEQLRLIKKGITRDELQKVKDMTKGRLLLRLEDSRSVAGFLAAQELLTNRVLVIEEVVAAIDSVKEEDILKQADNLLVSSRLNMAVVGPLKNGGDLKDLLFL
ncbi:MAG: insulinase family protein, partial [Dehalococcoidia bacterium]|nr:insulinase family protein [Dehalococcoidia bacterium]